MDETQRTIGTNTFTPRKKSRTSDERYSLTLTVEDWAQIRSGREWHAVVTDVETGQKYAAIGLKCGAGPECFWDAVAHPIPKQRPRKYSMPQIEPGKQVTGDWLREIADGVPGEDRDDVLAMAEALDTRGWVECAGRLFVTEAKTRELEAEAARRLANETTLPGFYTEWERTVGVYEYAVGDPELTPVTTMFAINPAASDEDAAERYEAVAQEHGLVVGRLS